MNPVDASDKTKTKQPPPPSTNASGFPVVAPTTAKRGRGRPLGSGNRQPKQTPSKQTVATNTLPGATTSQNAPSVKPKGSKSSTKNTGSDVPAAIDGGNVVAASTRTPKKTLRSLPSGIPKKTAPSVASLVDQNQIVEGQQVLFPTHARNGSSTITDNQDQQEVVRDSLNSMAQNLYSLDTLSATRPQIMVGQSGNVLILETIPLSPPVLGPPPIEATANTNIPRPLPSQNGLLGESSKKLLRTIHPSSSSFVPGCDIWPESAPNRRCWHCGQKIVGRPVRIARSYHDKHNVFTDVHGWFCSTACRSTYSVERNHINFKQSMLVQSALDDRVLGLTMAQSACRAPPSHFHEYWGGPCSDEDFKRISRSGLDDKNNPNGMGTAVVRKIDMSLLISSPAMFELTAHEDHCISMQTNLTSVTPANGRRSASTMHPELDALSNMVILDATTDGLHQEVMIHKVPDDFSSARRRQDDDNQRYVIGTDVQKAKFKVGGIGYDANYSDHI